MKIKKVVKICSLIAFALLISFFIIRHFSEVALLKKIIERLSADSRAAEVLVTDVKFDPESRNTYTTIKFLEYDTESKPLEPKYFTFSGNIIQFQSMVIRFDDFYIKRGHSLKGKSAFLFMKAFMLTEKGIEVFTINKANEIPSGYEVEGAKNTFEKKLWYKLWQYALSSKDAKKLGIKNAQLEAPGTKFVPGMLYVIKIEHDGGLRIDPEPLSPILKGEKVVF